MASSAHFPFECILLLLLSAQWVPALPANGEVARMNGKMPVAIISNLGDVFCAEFVAPSM